MSKYTLAIDPETAFISFYLAEKEFFHPKELREALTAISYLIRVKRKEKAVAIAQVSTNWKNKHNKDYSKEFLWTQYNKRLAYIKNAKDKFKLWEIEMREKNVGYGPKLCECGCGQEVKKGNRFIHGHNINNRTKEEKEFYTKNMLDKRPQKTIQPKIINVDFRKST